MADNKVNIIITAENKTKQAFGELSGSLDSLQKDGKATKAEIAAMGAAIVGSIAAIGVTAVTRFADFEAAMSKVKAVTNITGKEMEDMTALARQLGATTVFTSKEVADAMTELGQAGFTAKEIMIGIPATLDLAAAGGLGIARATEIASSTLRGFQMETTQTTHVVDVMAKTAATSNASIESFGEAMKYLAPTAHAFGISLEESSAVIGILSNAGIQGSLATRALGTSLARLTKPTDAMSSKMQELGVNFFDAQGNFVGMGGLVGQLEKSFVGLTQEQKMNALSTIFGMEAIQEMNVLLGAGAGQLNEYTDMMKNSDGAAKQMAATMLDNLNGAFEQLNGAVDDIFISLGSMLAPTIRVIAVLLTGLANGLGAVIKWVQQLPAPLSIAIQLIVGMTIAVVAGTAAWVALSLSLGGFWAAFVPIITAAGAFVLAWWPVIAVIAAVGAAMYLLYQAFEINLFGIQDGVRTFVDFMTLSAMWIKDAWANNFLGIQTVVMTVWNGIVLFLKTGFTILQGLWKIFVGLIMGDWLTMWDGIKLVATTVWDFLTAGWSAWTAGIGSITDVFAGIIKVAWTGMMEGIKTIAGGAWEGVKGIFISGINWIIDKMNVFVRGLSSVTGVIGKAIGQKNWNIPEIPSIPTMAHGGMLGNAPAGILQGPRGTDTTLYKGSPGEVVLGFAGQASLASQLKGGSRGGDLHIHLDGEFNGVSSEYMEDLSENLWKWIKPNISHEGF